jgi:hypothetical protein
MQMQPKIWRGPDINIDEYTGLIVIRHVSDLCRKGEEEIGYGYILESPPRIINLFLKKFAVILDVHSGTLKFFTSSFDTKGYVGKLPSPFILEMTQTLDQALDSFNSQKSELEGLIKQRFTQLTNEPREMREMREVQEEKDEKPQLAKSEEVDLESLNLVSNVGEEVAVEVLGGHEDVLVHYE